jgi:hypothetical protein
MDKKPIAEHGDAFIQMHVGLDPNLGDLVND